MKIKNGIYSISAIYTSFYERLKKKMLFSEGFFPNAIYEERNVIYTEYDDTYRVETSVWMIPLKVDNWVFSRNCPPPPKKKSYLNF